MTMADAEDGVSKPVWGTAMEQVSLRLDNGTTLRFMGRQFAGGSWYDEETGTLTRQTLYVTSSNDQVYVIVTGRGREKSRRAYCVSVQGRYCKVNDGVRSIILSTDHLLLLVRAFAGMGQQAFAVLGVVEETLRAANS